MKNYNDFFDNMMRQHERAVARHEKLGTPLSWRMRLRLHVASKLNTNALELRANFCGRRIVIKSRTKGEPLNEAEWIVIIARRFKDAETAAQFGLDLQAAISAIAAVYSLPFDVGFDSVVSSTFDDIVKNALTKTGAWLVDDIHGVDVYPDTQVATLTGYDAILSVSIGPSRITGPLGTDGKRLARLDDRGRMASLLMNAASMAPHPAARVTLGVAAVELLAAGERWNDNQKQWIKELQGLLNGSEILSSEEKVELKQAIDGLNHFGALNRTKRLLKKLELDALVERWGSLYMSRSRFFHCDKIMPFSQLRDMGALALEVGQAVIQAYIQRSTGVKFN